MELKDCIKKQVDSFKTNYCKKIKEKELKGNDINKDIDVAVELAYSDAKRTMANIGKDENTKRKEQALKGIKKRLETYFSKAAPKSDLDFDIDLDDLCKIWTSEFNDTDLGTYGKAQKIVNMTFKYLYCFYHTNKKYEDHFKHCHMPLDSYTLEWFKRKSPVRITIGKLDSWSKLQTGISPDLPASEKNGKYTYEFYRDGIRKIADEKGFSPLEIEFVVWPETQLLLATEAYLFALKPEWSNKKRADARKMSLSEKTKEINSIMKKNNLGNNETYWF